jgi:integrase
VASRNDSLSTSRPTIGQLELGRGIQLAEDWNACYPFPRADGRPQDPKTTWRAFDAAIKKANENTREDENLTRLTIHSLRHSFASIHLMNGTPIPEVSAMLGHANVNITLTVYTHFIPKMHCMTSVNKRAILQPDAR